MLECANVCAHHTKHTRSRERAECVLSAHQITHTLSTLRRETLFALHIEHSVLITKHYTLLRTFGGQPKAAVEYDTYKRSRFLV